MPPDDPHARQPFLPNGARRCQARSKRTGKQCGQPARKGYEVCRMHGAGNRANPGGRPPSPEARYSRLLRGGVGESFLRALEDPTLLEQRAEVALLQARLEEQLADLETGPVSHESARRAFDELKRALRDSDQLAAQFAMGDLERAIHGLGGVYRTWADIRGLIQERRLVVESERKRQVEDRQMIAADRFMAFMHWVRQTILAHVKDPDARSRIADDFRARLSESGAERPTA